MTAIITRSANGAPLSAEIHDANLEALDTALRLDLQVSNGNIGYRALFDGTLCYLIDSADQDRATILASNSSITLQAPSGSEELDLTGFDPGDTKFQAVQASTDASGFTFYSPVYRLAVTLPATLSDGTTANVTQTAADVIVTTNLATGRLYWGRYDPGSNASAAEIKAGSGTGFQVGGSVADPGVGAETIALSSLTAGTSYRMAFVHNTADDGTGEDSDVLYVDFTTASASASVRIGRPFSLA